MSTTLVVSRDPHLRHRIARTLPASTTKVEWVDTCTELDHALSLQPAQVLVDLNVKWSGEELLLCIEHCQAATVRPHIIAFLHEPAGELAVRARLAGADRIVPQEQLEQELSELLAEG